MDSPLEPPAETEIPAGIMVMKIPLEEIERNPDQPRKAFDEEALLELAESIQVHGVLQPLLLRRTDGKYQIVAGERRFRAASLAGLTEVPALIESYDDLQQLEIALIENIQREDLNTMEEARAYQTLIDMYSLSQEEVSKAVGKARATIANTLRLLKLSDEVQHDIEVGRISAGHARALLSLPTEEKQKLLHHKILAEELSVRGAEKAAKDLLSDAPLTVPEKARLKPETLPDPQIRELEEKLIESVGVMAKVKPSSPTQGKIEFHYASLDDLDRILIRIGVESDSL